ncbi:MAG: hypothetical protein JXM68_06945 [Sedimentisphaerales bacterium]|nr:hypothetical protein [Sedimentisphaerales bacterium]
MKKMLTLLAIAAATCSPVLAASMKSNVVPADSKIVAHVDVEAFRSSALAELSKIVEEANNDSGEIDSLKEMTAKLGFDPTAELSSVTAYAAGLDIENNGGVIIAEATNPVMIDTKIIETIKAEDPNLVVTSAKSGSNTIYSIGSDDMTGKLCFIDKKTLMLSDSDEQINTALKAFAEKNSSFKALSTTPAGSFFSLQVTGLQDVAGDSQDPQAQMIKQVSAITCFIGENQGNAFLNVKVSTLDPATAAQINQMAQGMLPFIAMQAAQNAPEIAGMLQQLKVTADGNDVNVVLNYPAKDIIQAMKNAVSEQKMTGSLIQQAGN